MSVLTKENLIICSICRRVLPFQVVGQGSNRDVRFVIDGRETRICLCGNNLADQWWREELVRWNAMAGK